MNGFIIIAIINVTNIISIFLIFSFSIKFILKSIFVITHLSNDGVLHNNRYSIRKISTIMYFIFLL